MSAPETVGEGDGLGLHFLAHRYLVAPTQHKRMLIFKHPDPDAVLLAQLLDVVTGKLLEDGDRHVHKTVGGYSHKRKSAVHPVGVTQHLTLKFCFLLI